MWFIPPRPHFFAFIPLKFVYHVLCIHLKTRVSARKSIVSLTVSLSARSQAMTTNTPPQWVRKAQASSPSSIIVTDLSTRTYYTPTLCQSFVCTIHYKSVCTTMH